MREYKGDEMQHGPIRHNLLAGPTRAHTNNTIITTTTMKLVICVAVLLIATVESKPQFGAYNPYNTYRPFIPIVAYSNDIAPDGSSYAYNYQTGNGITAQESGFLKNAGVRALEAQTVQGSFSYTSPEGAPIAVRYVADENGFRADGNSLPVAPPLPPSIANSLRVIARSQPGAAAVIAASRPNFHY